MISHATTQRRNESREEDQELRCAAAPLREKFSPGELK